MHLQARRVVQAPPMGLDHLARPGAVGALVAPDPAAAVAFRTNVLAGAGRAWRGFVARRRAAGADLPARPDIGLSACHCGLPCARSSNAAGKPGLQPRRRGVKLWVRAKGGGLDVKLLWHEDDQMELELDIRELLLLHKALSELCDEFDFTDEEFSAIFDASREEGIALARRMAAILDRLGLGVGRA